MTDDSGRPPSSSVPHPATGFAFVRVEYPSGPDRCTIHPREAEGHTLMATWLTADGGSVVDLAAMR